MHHTLLLEAQDPKGYLAKNMTNLLLGHQSFGLLEAFDHLIQLLARHVLHKQINIRVIFKALIQQYNRPTHLGSALTRHPPLQVQLRSRQMHVNLYFVLYAAVQVLLFDLFLVDYFQREGV